MRANHLIGYALLIENSFVDTMGNAWFNLKALGVVLGMANRSIYNATTRGWFTDKDLLKLGNKRGGTYISQPALYNVLMRSKCSLAAHFRQVLSQSEILEIRKVLRDEAKKNTIQAKHERKQFIQASFMDLIPNPYIDLASTLYA